MFNRCAAPSAIDAGSDTYLAGFATIAESRKRRIATRKHTFDSYAFFTGNPHFSNYWKAMRYFFHIFDGPKVFPDERGNRLSSPELAILQAKALAAELSKAGEFCRSNLVFVLDEKGNNIFGCRAV